MPLRERLEETALATLRSGRFILGPEVAAFEAELAAAVGCGYAVGVGNGTDALTLALRAMGVGPEDEVVVPSFTFYASVEAIPPAGGVPVFCDVDPATFNVTPETVRAALTPRTKAVIAVDLFGNPAPIPEIAALGVPVLEDAAQAAGGSLGGVPAGALGTAATFSFFPSKNLGGFGDGGAVTTDEEGIAEAVRVLRFHGSRDKRIFEQIGVNSRLDALQAALLRVLLPLLPAWAEGRRAAARHYAEAGLGELVALPEAAPDAAPAWHLYVIRHPEADRIAAALGEAGIGAAPYYRRPVHLQPAMAAYPPRVALPGTEAAAAEHLALPMSPVLSAAQAREVTEAVRAALAA